MILPTALPMTELSPLERHARDLAETAVNWAAQQTGGRTPAWEDLDWQQQAGLAGAAMTHIALGEAMKKVPVPEVVQ